MSDATLLRLRKVAFEGENANVAYLGHNAERKRYENVSHAEELSSWRRAEDVCSACFETSQQTLKEMLPEQIAPMMPTMLPITSLAL
ncbi:MAG: hypothetical protein CMJ78_15735 [Planctomycetaceae bacterium]|nr:hypothetical protein [Planctomycetaceae bacterium]